MTKIDAFRRNAAETMQLAQRAATTEDKNRLMKLAERWLDLADRTLELGRSGHRTQGVHPLLRMGRENRLEDQ